MDQDYLQFVEANRKNTHKLDLWEGVIFKLLGENIAYAKIALYLESKGLKVYPMEIYDFTHRKKRKNLLNKMLQSRTNDSKITSDLPIQQVPKEAVKAVEIPLKVMQQEQGKIESETLPKVPEQNEPVTKKKEFVLSESTSRELPQPFNYQEALAQAKLEKPT
jgi:hypothetical protein